MIAAILLATRLTPGIVAMSLESPAEDRATLLRAALKDDDALVRAAAARIVNVTDAKDLRDDVRAIGMMGGLKELDALLAAAKPFGLEGQAWQAVAAASGPAALDQMLANKEPRGLYLEWALRGHPELVVPTTARILGLNDAPMWRGMLQFLTEWKIPLDPALGALALTHSNREIAEATTWHFAQKLDPASRTVIAEALDRAVATTPNVSLSETFARELLGRALGRKPQEREEWRKWLTTSWRGYAVIDHLTRAELKAAGLTAFNVRVPDDDKPPSPIGNSAFTVMTNLPKGVGDEVLNATRCNGEWIGFASAAIDGTPRIIEADAGNVQTSDACKRALKVMIRSSLARDLPFAGPNRANDLLLAHHATGDHCFDEEDVRPHDTVQAEVTDKDIVAPHRIGGPEPRFPPGPRVGGIVILEALINSHGCISAMKFLKALTPELNTAAITAVSQWRFKPGMLNGKAVEVVYSLTINFKP